MSTVAELHEAVRNTLASRRLGTPVFVRYHAHVPKKNAIVARLARGAAEIRAWLGQGLAAVHAIGSVAGGSVSLTLEFNEAGIALLSAATGTANGAGVTLAILGNAGALYHDADPRVVDGRPDPSPDPELIAQIREALRVTERPMRRKRP
jgi:hypothetical protein